jgi:hypothetical protein
MSKYDLAQVVAALSFPIVTEIGLADAPASEAQFREQIAAMITAGGEPAANSSTGAVEGIGAGLDMPTATQITQFVLEVLLIASLHFGITETYEALRNWRFRRTLIVPGLDALVTQDVAIQRELQRRLAEQGLEDDQAHYVARLAVQAMLDLSSSPNSER